MDSGSDNDIATIARFNNEFFYKDFIEYWLDSDSADLMVVVASILHEDNVVCMPQWRGLWPAELEIWTSNKRPATCSFTTSTSTPK
jgi:hypothetical protein